MENATLILRCDKCKKEDHLYSPDRKRLDQYFRKHDGTLRCPYMDAMGKECNGSMHFMDIIQAPF